MQTLWLNSNKQHKRTSSCLGVSWDAKQNAWWAKLNVNGRRYDLGLHSGQISAYSEMAVKFGRPTNVIEDGSATVSRPLDGLKQQPHPVSWRSGGVQVAVKMVLLIRGLLCAMQVSIEVVEHIAKCYACSIFSSVPLKLTAGQREFRPKT